MDKSTTLSETLMECLIARKEELKITNAVIAERTGVPESTVTKLFNRTIKSPTFDTLAPIAKELNVSLDAVLEMEHADAPTMSKPSVDDRIFKMLIESYTSQLRNKDRWILVLAVLFIALVAVLAFFVIYDVTHPDMGWVQYATTVIPAGLREAVAGLRESFAL